jgi:hypothetical protein
MSQTFDQARDTIADALRAMEASGETGLEGLLRDALAEVTGQPFRIAKSGPQSGMDMRSERANTLQVALESKRYGQETPLPLDQLKAKLYDAAGGDDPADVWILAATRDVSQTNADALHKLGDQLGLAVVVLDWRRAGGALPSLAVLCASAPLTLKRHFPTVPGLDVALSMMKAHGEFASKAASMLEQVTAPDVGYASATAALSAWTRAGLTDRREAKYRLDGFNDVNASASHPIERSALFVGLDTWWSGPASPIALIGDEGHGKTWALLDWWSRRDNLIEGGLPLTIFLSARWVQEADPERELAQALARRTGLRTAEFWLKRLALWRRRPVNRPQILILLDGLDQKWAAKNWADFLQPLYAGEWSTRVAVAMASRPDRWQALHELNDLDPIPTTLPVPVFTEVELDQMLAAHGKTRSHFSDAVLELMKVPRLALQAIDQQAALAASGDVTPERLAYEDWKSRTARKGERLSLTDAEFQSFICDLAGDMRRSVDLPLTLTRAELVQRLSKDSGHDAELLAETISEIVSGRWIESTGRPHQFRVNKALTPFALGLALAAALRDADQEEQAEALISDAIDPYKGQDLGVEILRNAVTACLLDAEVGAAARRAALSRWLSERNFRGADFESFWRLIGVDKTTCLDVVERAWLDERGRHFEDEVLIKSLANAYQFPEVAEVLRARAETWLGWVWPDPDQGRSINSYDPTTDRAKANRALTLTNLAEWQRGPSRDLGSPRLELRETGDVSWMCHRLLGVLSLLPRADFLPALQAWALSRAVMAEARHFREVSWLLRWNPEDPGESAAGLIALTDALANKADPISRRASSWLMEAGGNPKAEESAARLRAGLKHELDSDLRPAVVEAAPEDSEILDPSVDVAGAVGETQILALSDAGENLWQYGHESGEVDFRFNRAAPSLARHSPGEIARHYRAAAASAAARDTKGRLGLAMHLDEILMVLDSKERALLREIFAEELAKLPQPSSDENATRRWRVAILKIDLDGASTEEQITLLAEVLNRESKISTEIIPLLKPLSEASTEAIFTALRNGPKKDVPVWLNLLVALRAKDALAAWPDLAAMAVDEDARIRSAAFEAAFRGRHTNALAAIEASAWRASQASDEAEIFYGSLALIQRHMETPIQNLTDRIDRSLIAYWVEEAPAASDALDAFAGLVLEELEAARTDTQRTYPRYIYKQQKAAEILVNNRVEWVLETLQPYLADDAKFTVFDFDAFPLTDLCRALMTRAPAQAARLWKGLKGISASSVVRVSGAEHLPLQAPDHCSLREIRREVVESAASDEELLMQARAAIGAGHQDDYFAALEGDVTSANVGTRARAITLLGFASQSVVADKIWEQVEDTDVGHHWLRHVFQHAHRHRRLDGFARHWLRQFLTAPTDDLALDAYVLLRQAVDRRAVEWVPDIFDAERSITPRSRRVHWSLNLEELNSKIKRHKDALKKTLYATPQVGLTQAPWI